MWTKGEHDSYQLTGENLTQQTKENQDTKDKKKGKDFKDMINEEIQKIQNIKKDLDKEVKKEVPEDKDTKIAELTNDLKRLAAEFDNYKKRCDREMCDHEKHANRKLVEELLPILDSFELSLKHKNDKGEFSKGMELIFVQITQILKRQGLRKLECVGKQFDPYIHEVLMQEEDATKADELITAELQPGYMLHDMLIRTSKVKVNKRPQIANDK